MHITIIALGTRGDVQPALALGTGLQKAGHTVRIAASKVFGEWIKSHHLEFGAVSVDIQAMMNGEGGKEWVESGSDPRKEIAAMRKLIDQHGWEMVLDTWNACQGTQAIISGFTSDTIVPSFAEKLAVPQIAGLLQPIRPTRYGVSSSAAIFPNRASIFNKWLGQFTNRIFWGFFEAHINRLRRDVLGLPPHKLADFGRIIRSVPIIHGFSEQVIPRSPDWGSHIHTSGYWFMDEQFAWQPPADLLDFLKAGSAPVYIGFGSMTNRNPQQVTALALEALKRSGQRGLLLTGWGGISQSDLPDTVFKIDSAPHDWLFPRMAAVVHHGGAGTTAAGLRAGVPSILIPHFADQPFWGNAVGRLGVGPKAIPRHKLTIDNLTAALKSAVEDSGIRSRAAALGEKIRAEDGVGNATRIINQILHDSV